MNRILLKDHMKMIILKQTAILIKHNSLLLGNDYAAWMKHCLQKFKTTNIDA